MSPIWKVPNRHQLTNLRKMHKYANRSLIKPAVKTHELLVRGISRQDIRELLYDGLIAENYGSTEYSITTFGYAALYDAERRPWWRKILDSFA